MCLGWPSDTIRASNEPKKSKGKRRKKKEHADVYDDICGQDMVGKIHADADADADAHTDEHAHAHAKSDAHANAHANIHRWVAYTCDMLSTVSPRWCGSLVAVTCNDEKNAKFGAPQRTTAVSAEVIDTSELSGSALMGGQHASLEPHCTC